MLNAHCKRYVGKAGLGLAVTAMLGLPACSSLSKLAYTNNDYVWRGSTKVASSIPHHPAFDWMAPGSSSR